MYCTAQSYHNSSQHMILTSCGQWLSQRTPVVSGSWQFPGHARGHAPVVFRIPYTPMSSRVTRKLYVVALCCCLMIHRLIPSSQFCVVIGVEPLNRLSHQLSSLTKSRGPTNFIPNYSFRCSAYFAWSSSHG